MKKFLKVLFFVVLALVVVGVSMFAGFRYATIHSASNTLSFRAFQRMPGQNNLQATPGASNNTPSKPGQGNNPPNQSGQGNNQTQNPWGMMPGYNMPFRGAPMMPFNNQQAPQGPYGYGNQGPYMMGRGYGGNYMYGPGAKVGGPQMMFRSSHPFFLIPLLLGGGLFGLIVLLFIIWAMIKLMMPKHLAPSAPAAYKTCSNCSKSLQEGWVACPYCGTPVEPKPVDKPANSTPPAEPAN